MNENYGTQNVQYKYVSAREKYCFGIGAIGKDAIVNLVGSFLMLYLTDTLYLAPAFVGVLFFVARIWDAVNDPVMGMIVDNTRTKYGKERKFQLFPVSLPVLQDFLWRHSVSISSMGLTGWREMIIFMRNRDTPCLQQQSRLFLSLRLVLR